MKSTKSNRASSPDLDLDDDDQLSLENVSDLSELSDTSDIDIKDEDQHIKSSAQKMRQRPKLASPQLKSHPSISKSETFSPKLIIQEDEEDKEDESEDDSPKLRTPTKPQKSVYQFPSFKEFLQSNPPVDIKMGSKSWGVFDLKNKEHLLGHKENKTRDIGAVTQLMTLYCVEDILRKQNMDPQKTLFTVSERACSVPGSTSRLRKGDRITVYDLLHQLMMVNGNESANVLAEGFGKVLYKEPKEYKGVVKLSDEDYCMVFVGYMDEKSKGLGMKESKYIAPDACCMSSVADQAKLALKILENQNSILFEIRNKKTHKCVIKDVKGQIRTEPLALRPIGEEWMLLKNGDSPLAKNSGIYLYNLKYLIVLLKCETGEMLKTDAKQLAQYVELNNKQFQNL